MQMGASCIHVFAVEKGRVRYDSVRRINIGGNNAFELFARSVILKHIHLK